MREKPEEPVNETGKVDAENKEDMIVPETDRTVSEVKGNPQYKDSLFCFIFGNEKHKKFTLDLYNTVNGTDYTDADLIELTTLEDIVYINIRNDISFIFPGTLNLYEHQSTFNPNMPIRMLFYLNKQISKYIEDNQLDIYGPKQITLPVPKFVCFYNGIR